MFKALRSGGGDRGNRTPNLGIANAALSLVELYPHKAFLSIIAIRQIRCQFGIIAKQTFLREIKTPDF